MPSSFSSSSTTRNMNESWKRSTTTATGSVSSWCDDDDDGEEDEDDNMQYGYHDGGIATAGPSLAESASSRIDELSFALDKVMEKRKGRGGPVGNSGAASSNRGNASPLRGPTTRVDMRQNSMDDCHHIHGKEKKQRDGRGRGGGSSVQSSSSSQRHYGKSGHGSRGGTGSTTRNFSSHSRSSRRSRNSAHDHHDNGRNAAFTSQQIGNSRYDDDEYSLSYDESSQEDDESSHEEHRSDYYNDDNDGHDGVPEELDNTNYDKSERHPDEANEDEHRLLGNGLPTKWINDEMSIESCSSLGQDDTHLEEIDDDPAMSLSSSKASSSKQSSDMKNSGRSGGRPNLVNSRQNSNHSGSNNNNNASQDRARSGRFASAPFDPVAHKKTRGGLLQQLSRKFRSKQEQQNPGEGSGFRGDVPDHVDTTGRTINSDLVSELGNATVIRQ